jgi:hypothetical protein
MLRVGTSSEYYLKRNSSCCSILQRQRQRQRPSSYYYSRILVNTSSTKNFKRSFRQINTPKNKTNPYFFGHFGNTYQSTYGNQNIISILSPQNLTATTKYQQRIYTTTTTTGNVAPKDIIVSGSFIRRHVGNTESNNTRGSRHFVPFTIALTGILIGIPIIAIGQGTYLLYGT